MARFAPKKTEAQMAKELGRAYKAGFYKPTDDYVYKAKPGLGKKVVEDTTYGLRAAGAALLANMSYFSGQPVQWDPIKMKVI